MKLLSWRDVRYRFALLSLLMLVSLHLFPLLSDAQNLGQSPQTGQAVQGQTAAQPEGTVLNLVNWVGNVISPVGAALAVVMAVVSYSQGRGVARWAVTAGRIAGDLRSHSPDRVLDSERYCGRAIGTLTAELLGK